MMGKDYSQEGADRMTEEKKSRYTEAQKKSAQKYMSTQYQFKVTVPAERKEEIQKAAAAVGESMNQFVIGAIDRRIKAGD